MHRPTRLKITDLNPHLTCILCGGYLVDANTIIECLHSFCRTCIVRYLETSKFCPICDVQVHKTKPLNYIRPDKTLQDMVYKLVPGLFKSELKRRRELYSAYPEQSANLCPEEKGEMTTQRFIYTPDETFSLSLEYGYSDSHDPTEGEEGTSSTDKTDKDEMDPKRRFLQCQAAVTVGHLKKFVVMKYGVPSAYMVDIMHGEDSLSDDYTLMDVAYIYTWRRNGPLRLFYRIMERPAKRLKTSHPEPSGDEEELEEESPSATEEETTAPSTSTQQEISPATNTVTNAVTSEETSERVTSSALPDKEEQKETSSSSSTVLQDQTLPAGDSEKLMDACSDNKEEKPPDTQVAMDTTPVAVDTEVVVPSTTTSEEDKPASSAMDVDDSKENGHASSESSDLDDLGCQPDLVVDEQKLDSSGEEADEGSPAETVSKKDPIDDEADATDDTEADSGRGSDISSSRTEVRSSCDDDIGSPVSTCVRTPDADRTSSISSTFSPAPPPPPPEEATPPVVVAVTASREPQKDHIGALDLSVSHRHGDRERYPRPRARAVANPPVLDKHRLPTCLPAPKHHSFKLLPATLPHSAFYKKSESRNHRFKGSNLTVINPDPNSFRPKIVIKNLDPRPSHGHHHHHHHHHHHRL